jgi:xanthine dehydrogenase accessory factor
MLTNGQALTFPTVLIRGAGEQATGVGWALANAGYRVVMTEIAMPLMVRWPVCLGNAVAEGSWQVEDVVSCMVDTPMQCQDAWRDGKIPVLVDPELKNLSSINPTILVDAIMAKRNIGTHRGMAAFTVGLGPGFSAGEDVDVVIETNRGHNLGRIIYSGQAEANTGIPSNIAGFSRERVIYSPIAGVFTASAQIGQQVAVGEILGEIVDGTQSSLLFSPIDGVLRGLLRTGTEIGENVKAGDVDPRGNKEYCTTISEKARMLGSTVLLAISQWHCANFSKVPDRY